MGGVLTDKDFSKVVGFHLPAVVADRGAWNPDRAGGRVAGAGAKRYAAGHQHLAGQNCYRICVRILDQIDAIVPGALCRA